MIPRILEPEVMDSDTEAIEYDSMDFIEVNTNFAQKALEIAPFSQAQVLDIGTGTARIPVLICQQRKNWQITAIDMANSMLKIAQKNITNAGLQQQIKLELKDAKNMDCPDNFYDVVISNSLVHHLPNPIPFLWEIKRVIKTNGAILIRDLIRPDSEESLTHIVEKLSQDYDDRQRKLFADSLHAAFTVTEVKQLMKNAGLDKVKVYQSSDIHWTVEKGYET